MGNIGITNIPTVVEQSTGAFPMPGGPIVTTQHPAVPATHVNVEQVAAGGLGHVDPAYPVRPVEGATAAEQALNPSLQQPEPELPITNVPALVPGVVEATEAQRIDAAGDPTDAVTAPLDGSGTVIEPVLSTASAPAPEAKVVTPPEKAAPKSGRQAHRPA